MRILVVTQYFWPESFIINGLVSELTERGHQVEVLTGLPNYPAGTLFKGYSCFSGPWTENYQGAAVHRSFLLPRGNGFARLALNYFSFVVGGCLKILFLKSKFDVIFCYAPSPVTACLPAIFARWRFKKPLVFWVQDLWPESISAVGAIKSKSAIRMVGRLVTYIYRHCDRLLMQSEAFKSSILSWGGEDRKISYVPNWAEPFENSNEIPAWVRELPEGFKIGFAGNIGKAQDMRTLLITAEMLKEHKEIKWIVAGDGSDKLWLDSEIKNRNLEAQVFTIGRKPYSEMLPFFKACDALYVSLTDEAIFNLTVPAKVQAYMSAGIPIIGSLSGEGARIIEVAGAGLCAPAAQPGVLAGRILKLMNFSSVERTAMGMNGVKYFNENFERSKVVSKIEEILKTSEMVQV